MDHDEVDEAVEESRPRSIKSGIDYELEELADQLLAQAKRDRIFPEEDPYDVLSPGQLDRRKSREIFNGRGVPEAHLFSGLYRRAYNPKIQDRPPKAMHEEGFLPEMGSDR